MEQLSNTTIAVAINEFLWHCRFEKNLDIKTIRAYQTDLEQFTGVIDKSRPIKEIARTDIKGYLQAISSFQPKTIKRKLASLRAMLNYYECEDETYVNPMRKMQIRIREPIRLPAVMTAEELRSILKEVYKTTGTSPHSCKMKLRDIAVVELLFATGIRVSELCNLKIRDVNVAQGIIHIIGKGNKERIIYVCQQETISALFHWQQKRNTTKDCDPFFINRLGKPLSPQSVRHMIHRLTRQTGLKKHITPHTFRHTLATMLLEEDVDIRYIQSILGHSSIATTQLYTHVNISKQKQIFQIKHPRRWI